MATALYDKGRENFAKGNFDLLNNTIKLVFVDSADYSVSLSTHDALDDVTGAGRVATSGAFSGKDVTNGVFDATDVTVGTVSGDAFEAIVIYKDTGVESTSYLICYIDNYTGLPTTPNGGSITVAFPNDSNKIFKL
jgi:hypothetical protein